MSEEALQTPANDRKMEPPCPVDGDRPALEPPRFGFERPLFLFSAGLMFAVTLLLAGLAATLANPVVISPQQIAESDAIIVAKAVPKEASRVSVERVFRGSLSLGQKIRVLNLPEVVQSSPGEFVLALTPIRRDYEITVLNKLGPVDPVVLVYPATPEAVARLKRLLEQSSPKKASPSAEP